MTQWRVTCCGERGRRVVEALAAGSGGGLLRSVDDGGGDHLGIQVGGAVDGFDNIFAAVWAVGGLSLVALSHGWLGWGPDVTKARRLVQVREHGGGDDEVRTVRTTFTGRGARRAARQVRAVLASGNVQAIEALPDVVYA